MNIYQNRLESFRNKSFKWPHTGNKYHRIETFAKAGFYLTRQPRIADNVRCFLCDINIHGWKEGQSPFTRHEEESPQCPWVVLNYPEATGRSLSHEMTDTVNQPRGSVMRAARLATFNHHNYWPPLATINNGTRLPPSSKLSDAGFYFTPTPENVTRIKCPYCHTVISHPDRNMNILQYHRQLSTKCLFFQRTHNIRGNRRDTKDSVQSTDSFVTAPDDNINDKQTSDRLSMKRKSSDDPSTRVSKQTKVESAKRDALDDSIWDINKAISSATKARASKPLLTYSRKPTRRPKSQMLPAALTDGTNDIIRTNNSKSPSLLADDQQALNTYTDNTQKRIYIDNTHTDNTPKNKHTDNTQKSTHTDNTQKSKQSIEHIPLSPKLSTTSSSFQPMMSDTITPTSSTTKVMWSLSYHSIH
ncbi:hypothetical protein BDB01DRAFT_779823, partial [Pilobolus umbonatus]